MPGEMLKLRFEALFYFVFKGNFQLQAPGGAYIWRGDLTEGFGGGLIFGGDYTGRGLFSEFYGSLNEEITSLRPPPATPREELQCEKSLWKVTRSVGVETKT